MCEIYYWDLKKKGLVENLYLSFPFSEFQKTGTRWVTTTRNIISFLRSSTIIVISRFKFKSPTSPCSLGKKETWNHRDSEFVPRTMGAQRSLGPVEDGKFALLFLNGTKDPRSFVYAYILTKKENTRLSDCPLSFLHTGGRVITYASRDSERDWRFFSQKSSASLSVVNFNWRELSRETPSLPYGDLTGCLLGISSIIGRASVQETHRNNI